jgi:hypothetical protein
VALISQSHSERQTHKDERRTKRAEDAAQAEYERTQKATEEHRKALQELESDDSVEYRDENGKTQKREVRRSPRAEGKDLDSLGREA